MSRLTKEEINKELKTLNGWNYNEEAASISKVYLFSNFTESMEFAGEIAQLAEKANHHPDITISYSKVFVELHTHESGGVTQKDIDLALKIEEINA